MDSLAKDFSHLYSASNVWGRTVWLGTPVYKCPLDLWMYQEILYRTRPDVIVETGTWAGGSALFLASICDFLGTGRIVTVDIKDEDEVRKGLLSARVRNRPAHPRITYVTGSSVDPDVITRVRGELSPDDRVMVVLDSDHSKEHVLAELRAYAPLVSAECYLIAEDTVADQVAPGFGGPGEAVEQFLAEDSSFVVDTDCEKFLMTFNPAGYLKRRPSADPGSLADSVDGSRAAGGKIASKPPTRG